MTEVGSLLEFATQVAELGGRIALEHFGKDPESKKKDDGSWVTEADWKTEAQIRIRIARTFPDHNILGEEEGLTAAGGGPPQEGAPTWVIDPIDGTNNFLAEIPIWGTLVGLQVDGVAVLGVANAPALGETYAGADGLGATMNGDPISVAPLTNLSEATSLIADAGSFRVTGLDEFFERIVSRSWRTRGYGDFWGHMLVARGAAHVMIDPELRDWDYVALQPIIREAGGRITQIDGSGLQDGRSGLTTNGALHDEVVRLAGGTPGPGD
jgi:histidinol-phosphatase